MEYEVFLYDDLKKNVGKLGNECDQIELCNSTIEKCENSLLRLESDINELPIKSTSINTEIDSNIPYTKLTEDTDDLKNEAIKNYLTACGKRRADEYKEFLRNAIELRNRINRNLELRLKRIDLERVKLFEEKKNPEEGIIIWRTSFELLLNFVEVLKARECLADYNKDEIGVHFCNDKLVPFVKCNGVPTKLRWRDVDTLFSILIDKLIKKGKIEVFNKSKAISSHFLNKKGKPFKYLCQKRNHSKNYCKSADINEESRKGGKYFDDDYSKNSKIADEIIRLAGL